MELPARRHGADHLLLGVADLDRGINGWRSGPESGPSSGAAIRAAAPATRCFARREQYLEVIRPISRRALQRSGSICER